MCSSTIQTSVAVSKTQRCVGMPNAALVAQTSRPPTPETSRTPPQISGAFVIRRIVPHRATVGDGEGGSWEGF